MLTISFCKKLLTDTREVVVMQLQFLGLMIAEETEAVPLDAAVRADLIDLMARVLVVVFHEEGGKVDAPKGKRTGEVLVAGSRHLLIPAVGAAL